MIVSHGFTYGHFARTAYRCVLVWSKRCIPTLSFEDKYLVQNTSSEIALGFVRGRYYRQCRGRITGVVSTKQNIQTDYYITFNVSQSPRHAWWSPRVSGLHCPMEVTSSNPSGLWTWYSGSIYWLWIDCVVESFTEGKKLPLTSFRRASLDKNWRQNTGGTKEEPLGHEP